LQPQWYATYTRSRHEKRIADQLERKRVDYFLPLYHEIRQWKNGKADVEFPLFPGYIFVRIPLKERLQVLEVPGVVRLVGFNGLPAPLPQADIEIMRDALRKGIEAAPHPYLKVGTRVRIKSGPLQGLQGILLRRKGNPRVVVSVDLIMRSIAIDIDASEIEPIR
jgi:transcription antitermination factor NusG